MIKAYLSATYRVLTAFRGATYVCVGAVYLAALSSAIDYFIKTGIRAILISVLAAFGIIFVLSLLEAIGDVAWVSACDAWRVQTKFENPDSSESDNFLSHVTAKKNEILWKIIGVALPLLWLYYGKPWRGWQLGVIVGLVLAVWIAVSVSLLVVAHKINAKKEL